MLKNKLAVENLIAIGTAEALLSDVDLEVLLVECFGSKGLRA